MNIELHEATCLDAALVRGGPAMCRDEIAARTGMGLRQTLAALALVVSVSAAYVTDCPSNSSETCSGPPTPDQFPQWLEAMNAWAAGMRAQYGVNNSLPILNMAELQWTQVREMVCDLSAKPLRSHA